MLELGIPSRNKGTILSIRFSDMPPITPFFDILIMNDATFVVSGLGWMDGVAGCSALGRNMQRLQQIRHLLWYITTWRWPCTVDITVNLDSETIPQVAIQLDLRTWSWKMQIDAKRSTKVLSESSLPRLHYECSLRDVIVCEFVAACPNKVPNTIVCEFGYSPHACMQDSKPKTTYLHTHHMI